MIKFFKKFLDSYFDTSNEKAQKLNQKMREY